MEAPAVNLIRSLHKIGKWLLRLRPGASKEDTRKINQRNAKKVRDAQLAANPEAHANAKAAAAKKKAEQRASKKVMATAGASSSAPELGPGAL